MDGIFYSIVRNIFSSAQLEALLFLSEKDCLALMELIKTHRLVSITLHHYRLARDALHQTSVVHTAECHSSVKHFLFIYCMIILRYLYRANEKQCFRTD